MMYTQSVPEKEGAGLENPNYLQRTNGAMPFFYVRVPLLRLHWAALMGGFGLPVAVGTGFSTCLCRPPRLRTGSGFIATYGSHNMLSRTTTPTQSRSQIIQGLTRQSTAIASMLFAFEMLNATNQKNALAQCHELATDVSIDLSALIGGAA
ncbi:hypothetical protein QN379_02720 [Glaciimonas sp. Gout2]|uniref:hypothetical protein n=1 Tax=unclassified Glaciimonas TaxID=2644401 RepID=UPI002B23CFD5|nr:MULTISPECIES: hypothetical protein [unclassified Glaciimonas]MEB0011278.1 hypothetical protein [Glaciimonas sp. Cout2]MEB0080928.1 hypothetical protein [Glaciimonas sp. Gout2]